MVLVRITVLLDGYLRSDGVKRMSQSARLRAKAGLWIPPPVRIGYLVRLGSGTGSRPLLRERPERSPRDSALELARPGTPGGSGAGPGQLPEPPISTKSV